MFAAALTLLVARMFNHTSAACLDVEVNPKMPRIKNNAVPEGNGPVPHDDYRSGEPTMAELQAFKEGFNRMNKQFKRTTSLFNRQEKRFADMLLLLLLLIHTFSVLSLQLKKLR